MRLTFKNPKKKKKLNNYGCPVNIFKQKCTKSVKLLIKYNRIISKYLLEKHFFFSSSSSIIFCFFFYKTPVLYFYTDLFIFVFFNILFLY